MNRSLVRAVAWASSIELVLLGLLFLFGRGAGPHSAALWLAAVPQLPAIAIMSAIMPNEAAGGPLAFTAYYAGLVAIQIVLWSAVLFVWFWTKANRQRRE